MLLKDFAHAPLILIRREHVRPDLHALVIATPQSSDAFLLALAPRGIRLIVGPAEVRESDSLVIKQYCIMGFRGQAPIRELHDHLATLVRDGSNGSP